MRAVVAFQRVEDLASRVFMVQLLLKDTHEHQCGKACRKVSIDMLIQPYVDRSGFEQGLCDLEGVLDLCQSPVNLPYLKIVHLEFAGHDGVVAIVLFFFPDLFFV